MSSVAFSGAAALPRLRTPRWFAVLVGVAATAIAAYLSLSIATSADYGLRLPVAADNAAPAINALAHGHVGSYLAQQPLMGLVSLLIRAPVAAIAGSVGAGEMVIYRLGALVCMLPLAALATWFAVSARAGGRTTAGLVAAAVVLVGSPTVAALGWGHPEEVLAATLATCAVLAATREHPVAAGFLAGAAVGTKEWAVIGLAPMVLALSQGRLRALAVAAASALALAAPPVLLDPSAFSRASHALGSSHLATALSGWWPISFRPASIQSGSPLAGTLPLNLNKAMALPLGLLLLGAPAVALAWSAGRERGWVRRRGRVPDAFALLCLLAIVRCVADPGPVEYYYVAAVIPLAAWELTTLRRLPVAALLTLAAVWLTFERGTGLGAGGESALTFAWAGPMICYLAARAFYVGRPLTSKLEMGVAT